jgi:hypothetical protein
MRWSLARLRPLHLVGLTLLYWAGLAAVKLGTAIGWAWIVSRRPDQHGSISAGLTNLMLHLSIARNGAEVWAGSVSLPALAVWVIGPPLLLGLTARWMRETDDAARLADGGAEPLLNAPPAAWRTPRPRQAEPRRERGGPPET